jgi:hypothetical protein
MTSLRSAAVNKEDDSERVYTTPHTASLFEGILKLKREIQRREQLPLFRIKAITPVQKGWLERLSCFCSSDDGEVECTLVAAGSTMLSRVLFVRASQGATSKNFLRINQIVAVDTINGLMYEPVPTKESRLMRSANCAYCFHSSAFPPLNV